jgi:hypothetical protein
VKAVFSFSLALVCALGWPSFTELDRELRQAKTPREAREMIRRHAHVPSDPDWSAEAAGFLGREEPDATAVERMRRLVEARAVAEGGYAGAGAAKAAERARELKRTWEFADGGPDERPNWLADVWMRLFEALSGRWNPGPQREPQQAAGRWDWVVTMAWVLLIVLAAATVCCLAYLFRHARWGKWRLRRVSGMLADDEPALPADEWLAEAGRLEAEGRYREAVRCLYLACLMRFDENRIASFVRGQTNWEHCRRIMSSPSRPQGFDFEPPTRAFDRVWYGHDVRGAGDVEHFRRVYQELCGHLAAHRTG